MKPRRSNPLSARFFRGNIMSTVMVVSLTALAFEPAAQAANQTYQDASALNTWNTTDANWDAGVVWTNGNTATFQGTGESVAVGTVSTSGITFGSAGYTLAGGTVTLTANSTITANSAATINSAISGAAFSLTKAGAGTLTLGGTHSYTGSFILSGGGDAVFSSGFSTGSTLGAISLTGTSINSKLTIESGTISTKTIGMGDSGGSQSGRIDQTGGTLTMATGGYFRIGHWSNGTSSASVYNLSGGTLDASPLSANSGAERMVNVGWDGTGSMNVGGGASTATLKAYGIQLDGKGNGGGNDGGNDTLTISPNGTVEVGAGAVNGASSGDVLILNGGTIKATAASSWGAVINANPSTTSLFDANGATVTLTGNITGSGSINLASPTSGSTISFGPSSGTQTVSAVLAGTNAITKTAAGTTTLTGTNTHTGTLTISAGRLNVGSGGSVASPTTIASGGTLGGKGTISGNVTASAGSFIAVTPASAGAITLANPSIVGQPTILFDSVPVQAQSPVTLFNYTGTLTGTPAVDLKGMSGFANAVINNTGSAVTLAFTTQNLTWGGGTGTWDLKTTANWNSGAQQFAWGDAVTFDDTSGVPTTITLAGELKPSSITVNSSTNNFTITGSTGNFISGSANLLKSGSSILTMNGPNTFTGGTVISQGSIYIQSAGALGTGTVTLGDSSTGSNNTALYIDTNRVNCVNPIVISANGTGTATLGTRSNVGGTGASNGFSGITLARDVTFDSNAADRTDYVNISGTGNVTIGGAGRTVFTGANTWVGNLTINSITDANGLQLGANSTAFNAIPDATNVTINAGGKLSLSYTASGSETINGLNGAGTVRNNGGNANTLIVGGSNGSGSFSGSIVNGSSAAVAFSLTKNGTGTQVLSGTNSYTGVTTISNGVLQFGKQVSLYNGIQASWTPANIKVASGATAAFNVGGTDEFTAGTVSLLLTNLKTISSNGLQSGSYVGFNTANASGGTFTISDVISNSTGTGSGAVGVRKLGAGTLVLSGASTYTGTTAVDAGTLEVTGNANSTAKFYTVAQGATLQLGYSTSVGFGYNCGVTVNGTSAGDLSGLYIKGGQGERFGGTLTLQTAPSTVRAYGTGSATLYGGDVNSTYLSVPASGSGSVIDSSVNIVCDSYGYRLSTVAGANTASGDLVINSVISGTGSNANGGPFSTTLRKEGNGSLLLNAANTYGNGLYIGGGTVIVGANNSLPAAAGVILNTGTYLRLNGITQTVSKVANANSGGSVVGNSATLSTLTISDSASATMPTRIGGTGTNEDNIALAKSGAGVLTLANASNSYTGGTTVNGGTLRVNDASGNAAGTGTITVNSGGTLDGYGNLNVGVIVSPTGGTVAGGELGGTPVSGDTLSVDSLTFQDIGTLAVVPGISSIDVTNDLTVSGGAGSVAVNIGTTPLSVGTYTLVTHGALSGTGVSAFAIGTNPGGPFTYTLSDNGSALQLTVATSALFWNGNNGASWSTANNWKNGSGSAVSFSNGAAVVFNDDATTLNVDLSSVDVSPLSVTFANSSSYDYTLAGSKAITGSAALLKSGTGSVTLDNTNSFTGDVTINQGTLNASTITDSGTNSALGKGSAIILGGGTLGYTGATAASTDRSITANATSTIRVDSGDLALTGVVESTAGLNKTGAGTLVLANAANYIVGSLSISGGAVQVDEAVKLGSTSVALAGGTLVFSGSAAITASQAVSLGAGGGFINVPNTDANGVTLSGAITGSTGLTKNGTGKLTLSTNKNFAGGVTVNNGTLFISGGGWYTNPFGQANAITINPGGKVQTAGAHSLGVDQNTVHINGGTLQLGAEQYISGLQMTGGLLTGGQLRTWGGTMTFNASATGSLIDSPSFQMVGAATLNVADGAAADDLTVSSGIFGSVGLIKSGAGKLVLQGINTHTGNTTVNAGTLQLKDDARLTFVIPASGASNKITGAGTAELDGDFQINTTAAAALTTGTWTLEDVTGTATYGSTFQVVESTGTPWTSSGDKWTKVSGTQLWTFDETTGVLTLTIAGYDAWATAYGLTGNDALRTSDPDNDGFSNLQEFLFGASPVVSTGSLVTMSQSGGNLVLTWLQRETGSAYQLKESTTLANGSWTTSSLVPALDDQTGVATDYDRWKVTITPASGKAFFRVEGTEN